MVKKDKPLEGNVNRNINENTNNINVNVDLNYPHKGSAKSSPAPNWYIRTIGGGIIALALSVGGYYIKKNLDHKGQENIRTGQSKEILKDDNTAH